MLVIRILTLCQGLENLLDIMASPSGGRHVIETQATGIALALLQWNLSLVFLVTLVACNHYRDVGT